jgi:hypothetical protein
MANGTTLLDHQIYKAINVNVIYIRCLNMADLRDGNSDLT